MAKLNEYISSQLQLRDPFYDWKLKMDIEKQMLELLIHLKIENPKEIYLQDENGNVTNEPNIYYEQVICFYNIHSPFPNPEKYVYAVGVDTEEGVECGLVDATLKHLNIYANELYSALQMFMNEEGTREIIIPEWNSLDFQNTVQTMKDIGQYDYKKLIVDFDHPIEPNK